jgi:hypothetical protein
MCCMCPETAHACEECPRVNNINPAWGLKIGGKISLDALYNSSRPIAPGTPFFLAPQGQFDEDTFDIHARETSIYLAADGPQIGCYKAGGLIMFALYNDSITVDRYGFLPYQAFGELKNEDWRFAGGLQMDIFAPVLPTVLPFSFLAASGNAGLYRGQIRAERFYHPSRRTDHAHRRHQRRKPNDLQQRYSYRGRRLAEHRGAGRMGDGCAAAGRPGGRAAI